MAPLPELVRLKHRYGAMLAIDEAHATLVCGSRYVFWLLMRRFTKRPCSGAGVAEALGVADDIDVYTGNFSKAFGSQGGYIASTAAVKQLLVNAGRSYVYSTALPVPVVEASIAALRVVQTVCCASTNQHTIITTKPGAHSSAAVATQYGHCGAHPGHPCELAHNPLGGG